MICRLGSEAVTSLNSADPMYFLVHSIGQSSHERRNVNAIVFDGLDKYFPVNTSIASETIDLSGWAIFLLAFRAISSTANLQIVVHTLRVNGIESEEPLCSLEAIVSKCMELLLHLDAT